MPDETVMRPASLRRARSGWQARAQLYGQRASALRPTRGIVRSTPPGSLRYDHAPGRLMVMARRLIRAQHRALHHWSVWRAFTPNLIARPTAMIGIPTPTTRRFDARPAYLMTARRPLESTHGTPAEAKRMAQSTHKRWTRIDQFVGAAVSATQSRSTPGPAGAAGEIGPRGQAGASVLATVVRAGWSAMPTRPQAAEPHPIPGVQATSEPSVVAGVAPVLNQPDLDEITTQVIRRIERRAVAQRERTARG